MNNGKASVCEKMTSLKLVFNQEEDEKINVLKGEYGLKTTTELVRLILALHYKEIKEQNKKKST